MEAIFRFANVTLWFCRIGTEHEKFGFEVNTLRPMKYDQIAELLNSIAERFEWEKVMEDDKIIGLKQVYIHSPRLSSFELSLFLKHIVNLWNMLA